MVATHIWSWLVVTGCAPRPEISVRRFDETAFKEAIYTLPFNKKSSFFSRWASLASWAGQLIICACRVCFTPKLTDRSFCSVLAPGTYEQDWERRRQLEQDGLSPGQRVFFRLNSMRFGWPCDGNVTGQEPGQPALTCSSDRHDENVGVREPMSHSRASWQNAEDSQVYLPVRPRTRCEHVQVGGHSRMRRLSFAGS